MTSTNTDCTLASSSEQLNHLAQTITRQGVSR